MIEPTNSSRIYLDSTATIYCVVSEEDYEWAIQWRWSFTMDKRQKKYYATRSTRSRSEHDRQIKVYMHKAILIARMKMEQPSDKHIIGDHADGESRNNTRGNLAWATRRQNNLTALSHPSRQRPAPVLTDPREIPF
jgi:hypothetical protein